MAMLVDSLPCAEMCAELCDVPDMAVMELTELVAALKVERALTHDSSMTVRTGSGLGPLPIFDSVTGRVAACCVARLSAQHSWTVGADEYFSGASVPYGERARLSVLSIAFPEGSGCVYMLESEVVERSFSAPETSLRVVRIDPTGPCAPRSHERSAKWPCERPPSPPALTCIAHPCECTTHPHLLGARLRLTSPLAGQKSVLLSVPGTTCTRGHSMEPDHGHEQTTRVAAAATWSAMRRAEGLAQAISGDVLLRFFWELARSL